MKAPALRKPGALSRHLVDFCRFLRSHGFHTGPTEEAEALQALGKVPFSNIDQFRLTLRVLFCKTHPQQMAFAELFEDFWQQLFNSFDAKIKPRPGQKASPQKKNQTLGLSEIKNWLFQHDAGQQEEWAFYSPGTYSQGHLDHYQADQISELAQIINQLAADWASSQSRRFKSGEKPGLPVDLRKSIRKNLPDLDMMRLLYRQKKIQKMDLVVLCDVSRSMELFSKSTVQMLYAFQNSYGYIDTFVFGSELYRISPLLKRFTFEQALEKLAQQVPDWSGGTRIGHALDKFIRGYGTHLLHKKTIVLIISDGWDTGEVPLLVWTMAYIQRRVKKVIWFNPQAGKPGYKPRVTGMKAALPYVDIFCGVHNAETLRSWQRGGYKSL